MSSFAQKPLSDWIEGRQAGTPQSGFLVAFLRMLRLSTLFYQIMLRLSTSLDKNLFGQRMWSLSTP
jgi:hypothetical protein